MSAYEQLLTRLRRMGGLTAGAEVLGWDQQVMMPPGGTEARAAQLAAISATAHDLMTAPETGRLLAEAERTETSLDAKAMLRETRFAYDRATKVPVELVEATSKATARGFEAWVAARKASDFSKFEPLLAEILDLRRKYAAAVAPGQPAYEALFQDFEPWIPLADARRNLTELREGLRPLIERVRKRDVAKPTTFDGTWPVAKQDALARKIVTMLGYDFTRGRLDTSPHPFSSGGAYDARITTRWDEKTPISGLLAVIHEAGHAMYQQGLPTEHMGTPLGEARDLVVHESQSRLWENHIGRSRAFWERILPIVKQEFPHAGAITPEAAWRAVNDARPTMIRVEADELTYHMHIALRFEIEEALVSGKLALSEVPHRWNEIMKRDLGLTPPTDAQGCLQDMHWSGGAIGYFPTYSLGSMLSAQLMAAYTKQHDANDYAALLSWLRANIHSQGKRYKTGELVERATGAALSPKSFLAYANEKYQQVWSK